MTRRRLLAVLVVLVAVASVAGCGHQTPEQQWVAYARSAPSATAQERVDLASTSDADVITNGRKVCDAIAENPEVVLPVMAATTAGRYILDGLTRYLCPDRRSEAEHYLT